MGKKFADKTLAEIVILNHNFIQVFEDYKIDYFNDGKSTLQEICLESGLEISLLESVLNKIDKHKINNHLDFQNMGLDDLIKHIEQVHHHFIRKNLPELSLLANKIQLTEKLSKIHQGVIELFITLTEEIMVHMEDEENIIFPHIRYHYNPLKYITPEKGLTDHEGLTAYESLMNQHEDVSAILKQISRLSDGYNPHKNDSTLMISFYKKLHEFEEDLHVHIHLENNILFPQAQLLQTKKN
ncbi:MAG: DUF542 domain-containing protein [Bacteroidetes bacterium]|nr:DUF542 domain-containing protein [Bacteroidota bacterium]MBT7825922.1 DUF542 domain-containing protein [Bacteroidota bacterium]MBT7996263.1 DUF542 domain-containing protein [Bacteroidota bacterium]